MGLDVFAKRGRLLRVFKGNPQIGVIREVRACSRSVCQFEKQRQRRHQLSIFAEVRKQRRMQVTSPQLRFKVCQPFDEQRLGNFVEAESQRTYRVQLDQGHEDTCQSFLQR